MDRDLIRDRREACRSHEALVPPRAFPSDGETIAGQYRRRDVPPGALAGLPVSADIVEGRARLVTDMAQAGLEGGDILVTTDTDRWTPLFLTVLIRDGQRIRVNGIAGDVEILNGDTATDATPLHSRRAALGTPSRGPDGG